MRSVKITRGITKHAQRENHAGQLLTARTIMLARALGEMGRIVKGLAIVEIAGRLTMQPRVKGLASPLTLGA